MIINRYLIRQIVKPLAAILLTLIALFGGFSAAGTLADAVAELLPSGMIAAMIGLKLLIALEVLIPISLYLAVVLAFSRLHGDSEFPAMYALGVAPAQVMRAVLTLAGCLALLVAGLSLIVRPWAYHTMHELSQRAETMLNVKAMQPGVFYVADHGGKVIFLAHREGPQAARHVFVLLRRRDQTTVIAASGAEAAADGEVHLRNAHVYEIGRGGRPDRILSAGSLSLNPDGKPGPLWYSSVAAATPHLAKSHNPADIAELQWRLSTGVSTILLGLLGIPLSRAGPRRGKYARFGAAILIYSTYYLLCSAARSLVQTGIVPAMPGLWWAPGLLALFLLAALYGRKPAFRFRRKPASHALDLDQRLPLRGHS